MKQSDDMTMRAGVETMVGETVWQRPSLPREPEPSGEPARTALGIHYEISARPNELGILRGRVVAGQEAGRSGELCYRALHGRDLPCPNCPAFATVAAADDRTSVVRRGPHADRLRLSLVSIRRIGPRDTYLVSDIGIDEGTLSELLSAKVDALAERGRLSARERSVLDYLLLGRSNEEIASALSISPRTVKYHQRNVQRKLGAESRVDLTRLIM